MSYKEELQSNNMDLQTILSMSKSLPDAVTEISSNTYLINATYNDSDGTYTFDKTFDEIKSAHESGSQCVVYNDGFYVRLSSVYNEGIMFAGSIFPNWAIGFIIYPDNTVYCEYRTLVTTSDTIPINKGGTGATTASAALTNLGAAAANHTHSEYLLTSNLSSSVTSTSTTTPANSYAVKQAYDKAASAEGTSVDFTVSVVSNYASVFSLSTANNQWAGQKCSYRKIGTTVIGSLSLRGAILANTSGFTVLTNTVFPTMAGPSNAIYVPCTTHYNNVPMYCGIVRNSNISTTFSFNVLSGILATNSDVCIDISFVYETTD